MSKLSPAAQAVWDAYEAANCDPYETDPRRASLSDALRAVADQVAPEDYSSYTGYSEYDFASETRNDSVREAILAIADELEAQ